MKILLISSEPLLSELVAFRLELLGHTVKECDSLSSLLEQLDSDHYSLLITDTVIPDSNARDAVASVRNKFAKNALSILVLSLDPSLDLVEDLFLAGADDYLLAPFEPNVLQDKIDKLLIVQQEMQ